MKRLCVALVFLFSVVCIGYSSPNFAGTWVVDKSKSEGLMGPQADAQSITWIVQQDAKHLTVESKTVGADGAAVTQKPLTYNLDGTNSTAEVEVMNSPLKGTLNTKWLGDGKVLEVNRVLTGEI